MGIHTREKIMIDLPLNFSAPTGQVQNTYVAPTGTNRYLTPSQYKGMQLHTPSGLFYKGGTMYKPYTPAPVTYNPYNLLGGSMNNNWFTGNSTNNSANNNVFANFTNNSANNNVSSGGPVENSIKIGNQYFRPFTGNAQGIINGDLSMVSMLNQQPTYQPQGIPSNLLNFLSSQNMQSTNNQQSSGAGRFLGLLGSPTTTNTQGK
jgi:hypothetical protein